MNFRASPKDNFFPEMSLPVQQKNTVSAALESTSQDWKVSCVMHFKESLEWIWSDSLTFRYVLNSDWFTYLPTWNSKNVITKLTCTPPRHTIITLRVYFFQVKCPIILLISLFPNYCFVDFCFSIQRNDSCNIRYIFWTLQAAMPFSFPPSAA